MLDNRLYMQEKATSIIQAIIIISAIFIAVAAFLVAYLLYFNKRKTALIAEKNLLAKDFEQQLLRAQVEMQETTYADLSRELHDNVGQLLSTSKILLGLTERSLENPPGMLLTANATLGTAINELRSLSKSLDKQWLEQFSFLENLETEISRINSGNIAAMLTVKGELMLSSEEQIILFRIVQEAIHNAVKHAAPAHIAVSVIQEDAGLKIKIMDDGRSFDPKLIVAGMGLRNMKQRTAILGGIIYWEPARQGGTEVSISLPEKSPQHEY
jgi:signal transduction histidine kinase